MTQFRTYHKNSAAAFLKTREKWGQFSNMCREFPISINGLDLLGTEMLYQSLRFTSYPEIQELVFKQESLYLSKKCCLPYIDKSRPNWMNERVSLMRWCLQLKIAQHWDVIVPILNESKGMPIVEISKHDDFWGAKEQSDGSLYGRNALGRLWMEQREVVFEKGFSGFQEVIPPELDSLFILNEMVLSSTYTNRHQICDQLDLI